MLRQFISFGPSIRNNEAMVFRNRVTSETVVLTNATSNAGIHLTCDRVKDLFLSPLLSEENHIGFTSGSLINERGNLDLGNIGFRVETEPVHTADGAVVLATLSVTFRLDPRHLADFLNFHSTSFTDSFVSRCRAALVSEIGSHKRHGMFAGQAGIRSHLEHRLAGLVCGRPGDEVDGGLGIILDKVALALEPSEADQSVDAGTEPITSLNSMRWIVDLVSGEPDPVLRVAIMARFAEMIESHTRKECARLLGERARLVIMPPQDMGLTNGMTAFEQINSLMQEPGAALPPPANGEEPPLLMQRSTADESPLRYFLPPAA